MVLIKKGISLSSKSSRQRWVVIVSETVIQQLYVETCKPCLKADDDKHFQIKRNEFDKIITFMLSLLFSPLLSASSAWLFGSSIVRRAWRVYKCNVKINIIKIHYSLHKTISNTNTHSNYSLSLKWQSQLEKLMNTAAATAVTCWRCQQKKKLFLASN